MHPKTIQATFLVAFFISRRLVLVAGEWSGREAQNGLAWLRNVHRPGGVLASSPNGSPCVICGGDIDYVLRYPHPDSLSLQHVKPRSMYPELTRVRSNWAPSHLHCNSSLGAREESPGGEFPEVYW